MGYSKDQLVAHLKELEIDFAQYEHPVVLTVEAQAKYVGYLNGALSKNLFLKDKKHRYYVVSALADTKVDMKILSQRLGLGKGGLRMAPEEALADILQVPLGCVTPFALLNESARDVSLLLDQGLRTKERCFFHPLSNDVSILIITVQDGITHPNLKLLLYAGLFPLKSVSKLFERTEVELVPKAIPPVGKDQPPDLSDLVPSDVSALAGKLEVVSLDAEKKNRVTADVKSDVKAKNEKEFKSSKKENASKTLDSQTTFIDADKFVQEILEKMSHVVLSEINNENINQHGDQLGSVVSNSIRKHLTAELTNNATIFKNTAYTEGFHTGIQSSNHRR